MAAMMAAMIILGSWTFSISDDKNSLVMRLLIQGLSSSHYTDVSINDEFSEHAFDLYLQKMDYNKRYFTARDINELNDYRDKLDDQVMAGKYDMYEKSVELFKKRMKDVEGIVEKYLDKPFDFSQKEEINFDEDKKDYASDKKELEERWRQLLKYQTLARMVNLKEGQQGEVENGDRDAVDSDKVLEKKARTGVGKSYTRVFRRMNGWTDKDYRSRYLSAVASTFDPHTNYYAPREKKEFDETFTGQYEGIGARLLEQDNGYIKITEVIPGGPAARQGELRAEDEIMKVAQGSEEAVDVVNMPVYEAVKLIKGKKGTTVNLTVKRGAEVLTIPITRDVVVLEETYAKSVLVGEEGGARYGYIRLPSFYADFQDPQGPNCFRDVAREIDKLTDNNVRGIILDLRNNGGGALYDAVDMAGLFIEEGPVVQVKSRNRPPYVLRDEDPSVQYDGPLVILVNEFSASASEILAAAMQDYSRAVVLGSPSTFGKGTVQSFVNLDRFVQGSEDLKPLGSVKLTTQKFYRINGGATQRKGVIPDVILPDVYAYIEMGEKERENALAWDEIAAAEYEPWVSTGTFMKRAIQKSQKRVDSNPTFQKVDENAKRYKANRDLDIYPLDLKSYEQLRASQKAESDKYKDIFQEIPGFAITTLQEDLANIQADSIRSKEHEKWRKDLMKDPYVFEAVQVLGDLR